MTRPGVSRRRALGGVAGAGLTLPLLAACGDDGGSASDGDPSTSSSAPTSEPATSEPTSEATSEAPPSEPAVEGIASTGDVPVGGGLVVADAEVVITQPTAGDYKVFTAVCTHSGCLVAEVTATIDCPCHGSTFDLTTGEPTGGPAPSALDAVDFQISGDQVVLS